MDDLIVLLSINTSPNKSIHFYIGKKKFKFYNLKKKDIKSNKTIVKFIQKILFLYQVSYTFIWVCDFIFFF